MVALVNLGHDAGSERRRAKRLCRRRVILSGHRSSCEHWACQSWFLSPKSDIEIGRYFPPVMGSNFLPLFDL